MTRHIRSGLRAAAVVVAATIGATLVPAGAVSAAPAECVPAQPGTPVHVTADCIDPLYTTPVIDSETDETAPVAHHRVTGHFEGTSIQFTIALPPSDQWQGRFFQYTYPLTALADANATERAIGFGVANGGYTVQAASTGPTSLGYRHAAAAAKFAETVAAEYYSSGDREIFGYLYGPSGGSFQTIGAAENTSGVWQGFVPMVLGVPMSTPYTFFIRAMARLVLEDDADRIADAVLPGGSGDPYAGLDEAEQAMLRELTDFGVPLRGWEDPDYLLGLSTADGLLGFGSVVRALDPAYADDFWSKPGYLGTEASPLGDAVRAALAQAGATDEARWDIALRSYYRHQLPPPSSGYVGFDQFRNADGQPLYPQRNLVLGPLVTDSVSGGASYTGHITGKVIVVDNLLDVDALPYHADWYADRVQQALGGEAFDENFRIYYNDSADHLEGEVTGARAARLVNYWGIVEQALRDVSAWVEDDVAAPRSTQYDVIDGQVMVPGNAGVRRGIQPTVDLSVRGGESVTIAAGEPVSFTAKLQVPPSAGAIVSAEWDFTGDGSYDEAAFGEPRPTSLVKTTHTFTEPGTYFVSLRATSERDGDANSAFGRVQNIDRVRVVVQ